MNNEVRTDSGLVVPASAITKIQRVVPRDTLKQIVRFVRTMHAEGIQILLGCSHCRQPITLELIEKLDEAKPGGKPVLVCPCSERVVR